MFHGLRSSFRPTPVTIDISLGSTVCAQTAARHRGIPRVTRDLRGPCIAASALSLALSRHPALPLSFRLHRHDQRPSRLFACRVCGCRAPCSAPTPRADNTSFSTPFASVKCVVCRIAPFFGDPSGPVLPPAQDDLRSSNQRPSRPPVDPVNRPTQPSVIATWAPVQIPVLTICPNGSHLSNRPPEHIRPLRLTLSSLLLRSTTTVARRCLVGAHRRTYGSFCRTGGPRSVDCCVTLHPSALSSALSLPG